MATAKSAKEELLSHSTKLDDQSDGPFVHKLPMDEVFCDQKLKVRKMELRGLTMESPVGHRKVFLIIGESGSGKTTLVNSIVNYMLCVTFEDNFRFKITNDPDEDTISSKPGNQNQWITSYTVDLHERSQQRIGLTIVDTPGFGDTFTAANMWKYVDRISEFVSSPDELGLVVPASTTELPRLLWYFQSILSRFDKNANDNVHLLVTFADVDDPPVLQSLKESQLSDKMLLKFNNSALFAKHHSEWNSTPQQLNKLFWDMSMSSLKVACQRIFNIKPKPLPKPLTRGKSLKYDLDQEPTKLGCEAESRESVQEEALVKTAKSAQQTAERAARERSEEERRMVTERAEEQRREQKQKEKEDKEKAKAEKKAEKKARAEKKASEERAAQEALLKAAKDAQEAAERERAARERAEEEVRMVAERAAKERVEAERRAAEERILNERAEAERRAAQEKEDKKKAKAERKAEKKARAEKKASEERAVQDALAALLKAAKDAKETADRERAARERAEEEVRMASERTARERAEAERRAVEERILNERAEAERRAAQEKADKKKAKAERQAAEKKALEDQVDALRAKVARDKAEADKLAAEKAKAEEDRRALENKVAKKAEKLKKKEANDELQRTLLKAANDRAENEKAARENAVKEKQAIEDKVANERLQKQLNERRVAEEKAAKERAEAEKQAAKDKMMADLKQKSVLRSLPDSLYKLYELKMDETFSDPNIQVRKVELGCAGVSGSDEKVIMIVGETGSGKTTLINSMVNYLIGVDYEDQFRFKIIADEKERSLQSSAKSQTQWVTSYTFHHREGNRQPFTLTLVDTPGFGDTGGIINDKKIVDRIKEFFSSRAGIDHLDAVGFVVPSSAARLTQTQQYMFDSILALFGKDIGENIYVMITHADANTPPVLESLKVAKINYQMWIKLNNSAFFPKTDGNEMDQEMRDFNKTFWDMGIKGFERFFKDLLLMKPKSLTLTKEVLHERQVLQTHLIGIKDEIDMGLCKLNKLETELGVIKSHKNELDRNKDFKYTVTEEKVIKEDIPVGQYITNCLKCNRTCHYPCAFADDKEKFKCSAMTDGKCHVCKSGCVWSVHTNMTFKLVIKQEVVEKTSNDLLNRYRDAEGKLLGAKQLAQKVYEEYLATRIKIMDMVKECKKCLERLQKIALKPDPLSEADYIDKLIEAEQMNKADGYAERIKQLKDIRELAVCAVNLQKDELVKKLMDNEERVKSKFPDFEFHVSATAVTALVNKGARWIANIFK